jgi:hypothetical protein
MQIQQNAKFPTIARNRQLQQYAQRQHWRGLLALGDTPDESRVSDRVGRSLTTRSAWGTDQIKISSKEDNLYEV